MNCDPGCIGRHQTSSDHSSSVSRANGDASVNTGTVPYTRTVYSIAVGTTVACPGTRV